MQNLYLAIEFAPNQPGLREFSFFLHNAGFPHRISEYGAGLALWVVCEDDVPRVRALYQRYCAEGLSEFPARSMVSRFELRQLLQYPVTLVLVALSVVGFAAVSLDWHALVSWFSFQGFIVSGDSIRIAAPELVRATILQGEFWRLVTPVFLHFDFLHIGFNMALLWFLASQVERSEGRLLLLLNVLVMAALSNMAQFAMSPDHLFGGMSGVNYGLLAYCVLANSLQHRKVYHYPSGLLLFSVVMMAAGFFGLFSLFGYSIANWAHLAGLLAGFAMAVLVHGYRYFHR